MGLRLGLELGLGLGLGLEFRARIWVWVGVIPSKRKDEKARRDRMEEDTKRRKR